MNDKIQSGFDKILIGLRSYIFEIRLDFTRVHELVSAGASRIEGGDNRYKST